MSPSSSGGGNEGSHPPEPIGTTSPAPRTRASKVNELGVRRGAEQAEEGQKAEDAALAPHSVPQLQPPSVSASTSSTSNFQWSHHLTAGRCFDSTPSSSSSATVAHPPLLLHPLLSLGASRILILHPPPPQPKTSRQTGGLTPAGHDARVSPTRDGSSGTDGAADRAAAPGAARTGCPHRPSPGPAARRRAGRGAPTCNSARLSECQKGEAMLGFSLIHNFDKCDD